MGPATSELVGRVWRKEGSVQLRGAHLAGRHCNTIEYREIAMIQSIWRKAAMATALCSGIAAAHSATFSTTYDYMATNLKGSFDVA